MTTSPKSLLDPETIQCPYPLYEEMRRERPITYLPELKGYFVSNYELAKLVLTDLRFQKMPVLKDGSKFVPASQAAQDVLMRDEEIGLPIHCLSESGGARQSQFRKIVDPYLGRRGAAALEPHVQECADLLLDQIKGSDSCEFVSQFSTPYTIYVICEMVGMPRSMLKEMKAYADAALAYRAFVMTDDKAIEVAETLMAMHDVIRAMIRERRSNPKNDMLTILGEATVDGKPLTERERVYIIEELVLGGNETTANAINGGMMHLASHAELQETIRRDPAQTPAFVEEALRLLTPIQAGHRIAQEDIDVGGTIVKAGQKVYVGTASANRDEAQFKCPTQFDHHREDGRNHVAFGGGQHFCLGSFLTKIEQRVAYDSWLKRFSSIELLQPFETIQYHPTYVTRSPVAVPLGLKRS